jgi:glycosyltransferase involved in cell wall biosynthesis
LKVLFLQDHLSTGGAARAASRCAAELRKLGVEVEVAAGDVAPGPGQHLVSGKPKRGWGRLRQLFQDDETRRKCRQDKAEQAWGKAIREFRPELIWIHNIHAAFKWGWGLRMVEVALRAAPVLWTLHDMWALGDGPSYFPETELKHRWNLSPLRKLREARPEGCLTTLTPSVWLRDLVSSVDTGPCEAWPNPLDTTAFQPMDRESVRRSLGLGDEDILLMAAAENLADPRKGIDLLEEAWKQGIRGFRKVWLGLAGRNCPPSLRTDPQVVEFGSVASEQRMAQLMSAADLFLHPARVESYGLVLEEAQACGTPVVAFAGGGVEETFVDGTTGWRIENKSAYGLGNIVQGLLQDLPSLRKARGACRAHMMKKHRHNTFANSWHPLLAGCLDGKQKKD